ncbi:PAAR domain-containing protein [Pseudomonas aeruginosa]|uniref:PAAR domain-containing protein n=1 Tax=Pseudomonas aeruginosa TaxID=287 RepID=UPI000FD34333|nr:PAAR domain-containing protein [Pseudomonas aeruginosa]RUJ58002.1 PAAR domain-containing protein [Pseudomonas aeruginosa]
MRANLFGKAQSIVGDVTSHGGVVISGNPTHTWNNIPIARQGDLVTCPKCPPHIFKIAEGLAMATSNGQPMAAEGHKTTCGAVLIAQSAPANMVSAHTAFANGSGCDEQFVLQDSDGNPIPQMPYKITVADGSVYRGVTDIDGRTERVISAETQGLVIEPDMDRLLSTSNKG